MVLVGLTHLNVGQDQLTGIFDAVAAIVQAVLTLIAGVMTFAGMVRKLWITINVHQQATTGTTTPQQ